MTPPTVLKWRAPGLLFVILLTAGCAGWPSGTIDYNRKTQIFEFPTHDPMAADQTSRYYELRKGNRVAVTKNYPTLPIDAQTIIVEVWSTVTIPMGTVNSTSGARNRTFRKLRLPTRMAAV
jgi:hypothetical protein